MVTIAVGQRSKLLGAALAELVKASGVRCAGTASDARGLAELVRGSDVAVCDLDIALELYAHAPRARVVVICAAPDPSLLRRVIRHSPIAVLGPEATSRDLVDAVRSASEGRVRVSPSIAGILAAQPPELHPSSPLTSREIEILQLLAEGQSNREIADALGFTSRTAAAHVSNILEKLSAESRTRAVAYGLRTGLVRVPGQAV